MTALAFDTHATVKALTGAGFDEAQTEAITGAVSGALSEGVASKADIVRLEGRIDARIDSLKASFKVELYRALWIQGAGVAAIVAGLLALSRFA